MDRPEPPPLSIWIVNPGDDIPGEGAPASRSESLARVLAERGHDVTWWTSSWSHRRKASRTSAVRGFAEEKFAVKFVAARPYTGDVSLARLASHRDFGRTFERLASESVATGQLERPDIVLASLPPLEVPEAAARLANRLDAMLVVDVTETWPAALERLLPGPRWLRRPISAVLFGQVAGRTRAVLEAADAVSAAAHGHLESLPEAALAGRPMHVCHVGAWVAEFPPPPRVIAEVPPAMEAEVATASSDAAAVRLCCVCDATGREAASLDTLAAAVRAASSAGLPVTIHVLGAREGDPAFRRVAGAAAGSCEVRMHGPIDRAAHVGLLTSCGAAILLGQAGTATAVPGEVFDLAAAGLALVSPWTGELERSIADHRAGVRYDAASGESLARAVSMLAGDPRMLAVLRQGARRMAEAEFDRERTYSRFAAWIEGLAKQVAGREAGQAAPARDPTE